MADMRVAILGATADFEKCVSFLKMREAAGEIEVLAVADEYVYARQLFGWPFLPWQELRGHRVDCVVNFSHEGGLTEALAVPDDFIIPWEVLLLPGFTFQKYLKLKRSHLTIVSNNCWGGVAYHYFHLPFYSPFINMWENPKEYISMLTDEEGLRKTLAAPMEFVKDMETSDGKKFPVYSMNGVSFFMNHYFNGRAEAEAKWRERTKRVNYNNILYVFDAYDNREGAETFDKLPYEKKVCFTNFETDLPSAMYLPFWNHVRFKDRPTWEAYFAPITGEVSYFDRWQLLFHGFDQYKRNCIIA